MCESNRQSVNVQTEIQNLNRTWKSKIRRIGRWIDGEREREGRTPLDAKGAPGTAAERVWFTRQMEVVESVAVATALAIALRSLFLSRLLVSLQFLAQLLEFFAGDIDRPRRSRPSPFYGSSGFTQNGVVKLSI